MLNKPDNKSTREAGEIKRCPCGREAIVMHYPSHGRRVECVNCTISGKWGNTREQAIMNWTEYLNNLAGE